MKAEYMMAEDVFDDDNNGLRYGIEYWEDNEETEDAVADRDVQWFATAKDRDDFAKAEGMEVINANDKEVSAMNNGVKELLEVISDYADNIKYKNEEHMISKDIEDKVIEELNKAGDIMKAVDLDIVPGKVESADEGDIEKWLAEYDREVDLDSEQVTEWAYDLRQSAYKILKDLAGQGVEEERVEKLNEVSEYIQENFNDDKKVTYDYLEDFLDDCARLFRKVVNKVESGRRKSKITVPKAVEILQDAGYFVTDQGPYQAWVVEDLEGNDHYFDNYELKEYALKVSNKYGEYTVWVGGVEVNDYLLPKEEAEELADEYRENGYDDVSVEKVEPESIESSVLSMYEKHVMDFDKEHPEEDFDKSEAYGEFKKEVITLLTSSIKDGKIKGEEFGELVDKLEIKLSEEELNKIVAEKPPKPTTPAPDGQKWVFDTELNDWVLMSE